MQIHELNSFSGTPSASDYLVTDNGTDTSKIPATELIAPAVDAVADEVATRQSADALLQSQIDQLVAPTGTAPNPAEIENARIGADNVTYTTLGSAIRTQVSDLKADFNKILGADFQETYEAKPGGAYYIQYPITAGHTYLFHVTNQGNLKTENVNNTTLETIFSGAVAGQYILFTATVNAKQINAYFPLGAILTIKDLTINLNGKIDNLNHLYTDLSAYEWELGSIEDGVDTSNVKRMRSAFIPVRKGDIFTIASKYSVEHTNLLQGVHYYDYNYNWLDNDTWSVGQRTSGYDGYARVVIRTHSSLNITDTFLTEFPKLASIYHADTLCETIDEIRMPNRVPLYWNKAVNDCISTINEKKDLYGLNGAVIGFITDTHYQSNSKVSGMLMQKVVEACDIPCYVDGGDIVTGSGIVTATNIISDIDNERNMFSETKLRRLPIIGNHDYVYGQDSNYDSQLTDEVFNAHFFADAWLKDDLVYGSNGTYYYKDLNVCKIRVICLNSENFESVLDENGKITASKYNKIYQHLLGQDQFDWLANDALNMPSNDWECIIFSHVPLTKSNNSAGTAVNGQHDYTLIKNVITAFNNKTTYSGSLATDMGTVTCNYDFTNYKGSLICCVAGHEHYDDVITDSAYKTIITANDSCVQGASPLAPTRTAGTTTEHVISFFCIDKENSIIHMVRLGAGSNADISY